MSFGGGWFFVAASEAISVLNKQYTLPGIGSYVAEAVSNKNLSALGWAVLTIAIVILLVDQLFWRPLIAWSDKFRMEQNAAAEAPESWVYDLLRTARLPYLLGKALTPFWEWLNRLLSWLMPPPSPVAADPNRRIWGDRVYYLLMLAVIGIILVIGVHFILTTVGPEEVLKTFGLGILTLLRVIVLLLFATLIWTPIGVAIGFNPKIARLFQPIAQFLASFPANFIFPFATLFFIHSHQHQLGQHTSDGAGCPMVYPVQLDRWSNEYSHRSARDGDGFWGAGMASVAQINHSWDFLSLGNRRHHGQRRCLERKHCFRGGLLGTNHTDRQWIGSLYNGSNGKRRLAPNHPWNWHDEPVCCRNKPYILAAVVSPGRNQIPSVRI